MTKINFGSTCHKMMWNTSIMGFLGLPNPFLVFFSISELQLGFLEVYQIYEM